MIYEISFYNWTKRCFWFCFFYDVSWNRITFLLISILLISINAYWNIHQLKIEKIEKWIEPFFQSGICFGSEKWEKMVTIERQYSEFQSLNDQLIISNILIIPTFDLVKMFEFTVKNPNFIIYLWLSHYLPFIFIIYMRW